MSLCAGLGEALIITTIIGSNNVKRLGSQKAKANKQKPSQPLEIISHFAIYANFLHIYCIISYHSSISTPGTQVSQKFLIMFHSNIREVRAT
jgi:ribulose-5-phosphate 4-epimerase/fuculose-1-phosphate aldolase